MKKLLLGLGSVAVIAAPIAVVVSCGSSTTDSRTTAEKARDAFYLDEAAYTKAKAANVAGVAVQTRVDVTTALADKTTAKTSTIARFVRGEYTSSAAQATDAQILAPKSTNAITGANVNAKIAATGHFSIFINLLKLELTNEEAKKVHEAFVIAFKAEITPTVAIPPVNSLNAKVLYTALNHLDAALKVKLNFTMFAFV